MIRRIALPLLIAGLSVTGWARDAGRYPVRRIDRPLILPKGMWQERLTWTQLVPVEEESLGKDAESVRGFLPNLPSWSITDNLSWAAVPFPLFQYLLTRNNIGEGRPRVDDFSLTLDGGLTGLSYSSREGTETFAILGMSFKRPWTARFWNEGSVQGGVKDADPFSLVASLEAGIQLSDRIYSLSGYTFSRVFAGKDPIFQAFTQRIGINFHPGLSLELSLSLVEGRGEFWWNPGSSISFQW